MVNEKCEYYLSRKQNYEVEIVLWKIKQRLCSKFCCCLHV